jgi:hypothetical protein
LKSTLEITTRRSYEIKQRLLYHGEIHYTFRSLDGILMGDDGVLMSDDGI